MDNQQLVYKLRQEGYSLQEAEFLVKAIESSAGGMMSPQQLETFIETVVAEKDFFSEIKVITGIESEDYEMHIMGLGERLLRKAVEGQAPAGTNDVTISKRVLSPVEVILAFDITKKFLKRNIARGNADGAINKLFAKQYANDLLDLAINGDTNSADPFESITNGWLAKAEADADAHVTEHGNDYSPKAVMGAMINVDNPNALPAKWLVEEEMAYICSPGFYQKYQDELAEKNTQMGDLMTVKKQDLEYKGIPLKKLSKFPSSRVMLTWKENLHIGVGQDMYVDFQWVSRKRLREYTTTGEIDFNYAISDMMVVSKQV